MIVCLLHTITPCTKPQTNTERRFMVMVFSEPYGWAQVWPDEGDVNMYALAETLFDAGHPSRGRHCHLDRK